MNGGIGSNALNAEVKALERLQIVRGRKSTYFGSKYRSCTVRQMLWSLQLAFDERLVDHHLCWNIGEFTALPIFDVPFHRLEIPLHLVDAN